MLALFAAALAFGPVPDRRPNIVYVIADDLGKPNVGFAAKVIAEAEKTEFCELGLAYGSGAAVLLHCLSDDHPRACAYSDESLLCYTA